MSSGTILRDGRIEVEFEADSKFVEEAVGGPAFFHEEILDAGAVAAFAQALLIAEDFGDGANDGERLSGSTKASRRTARWGSLERPPPTRRE